jgi:Zn-dependent protease
MSTALLVDGMWNYAFLLILLTFHEYAHAWTALKCGDDTALREGRVSLNPIVHMDLIGTVILPLLFIFLAPVTKSAMFFGWAKPVPVTIDNLRRPRIDDVLIAMAGPAMNLLLAVVLIGLAKAGILANSPMLVKVSIQMAHISLVLCFFNLIPVPPLDGSHLIKNLFRMSYETYMRFARFGFIIVLVLINLQPVRQLLAYVVYGTEKWLTARFGIEQSDWWRALLGH